MARETITISDAMIEDVEAALNGLLDRYIEQFAKEATMDPGDRIAAAVHALTLFVGAAGTRRLFALNPGAAARAVEDIAAEMAAATGQLIFPLYPGEAATAARRAVRHLAHAVGSGRRL